MNPVRIIAWNTFREAVRDRVLYNLVFFVLVMIAAAVLVGQISIGIERLIIVNLGLTAISIFGVVMAVFIGVGLVHKEMERRTLYSLLSKPIHRWEFIAGKFAGLGLTLLVNTFFMTLGLGIALYYVQGTLRLADAKVLLAVLFILLQLTLLTALALLFSCYSSPLLSTIFTLGLYVMGVFSADIRTFGVLSKSPALEGMTTVLYYVLPNFNAFNIISVVAHENSVPAGLVAYVVFYALVYTGAVLLGAVAIFSNRNFK